MPTRDDLRLAVKALRDAAADLHSAANVLEEANDVEMLDDVEELIDSAKAKFLAVRAYR